ncbi:MAG: translational GTPase TypA [Planctomycetota bacterium]|nr:translational GTPase TypA [Planctomycetota bacterium]
MTRQPRALRNVAIIAHVDHGKTTLVDALLTHSGTVADLDDGVCVLDSNPLERERGITILSKNCGVELVAAKGPFAGERIRVNIIDTPGHADFGGEVERVLRMADGALLLVDAAEGPMPQTRHVLAKALELGMKPIVVVNKCDRPDARPDAVVDEVFDLLVDLEADEDALDFPTIYASGRQGWAGRSLEPRPEGIEELVEEILERVPPPADDPAGALQMLVTTLDSSEYTGRIAIGRVFSGVLEAGKTVGVCRRDGGVTRMRPVKILRFEGLGRVQVDRIEAGDLCALEGLPGVEIGDTIADVENPRPLPRVAVDEPTLDMIFRINDSPFAGREGKFVTSRQIAERLDRELERNVALRVAPGDSTDEFRVSGRGMLHLGVLLETMRREGYELAVGKPEVIEREIDGVRCEPVERLTLDTAGEATGPAMELLGSRGAEVLKMELRGERMHVEAEIPARGLIGLRTRLLNATGGEAIMHHSFASWKPVRSSTRRRANGVMVANEQGTATTYALLQLSERGTMFVKPGDPIYAGQVVGENSRDGDMTVNAARAKAFSNVRETSKDATVVLKQPREITLEAALEYIEADELVEITPNAVRLRKRLLSEQERRRVDRAAKSRAEALKS